MKLDSYSAKWPQMIWCIFKEINLCNTVYLEIEPKHNGLWWLIAWCKVCAKKRKFSQKQNCYGT